MKKTRCCGDFRATGLYLFFLNKQEGLLFYRIFSGAFRLPETISIAGNMLNLFN
jgi:hypothetical protein